MLANEDHEQKASSLDSLSKPQSATSSSTQSDIIARTIALAKAKQNQEDHPLSGGLFSSLNLNVQTGLENTPVPDEKIMAKIESNSTAKANNTVNAS